MDKIRYINLCIVEFANKHGMTPNIAFNYLNTYKGLQFLNECYEAEHLLSLEDALSDLTVYCQRHGGTIV